MTDKADTNQHEANQNEGNSLPKNFDDGFEIVDALAEGTADSPVEITESGLTLNLGMGDKEFSDAPVSRPVSDADRAALAQLEAQWAARPQEDNPNPTLERVEMLLDLLGNPQRNCPVIQVAGTNGKSSTARMIDSLLRALHQRVGLFVSPKMTSATNLFVIDGEEIHPADLVAAWEDIAPYVDMVDAHFAANGGAPMSAFEIQVALAYSCFADAPVSIAVVEVGMGGTWDATNVVNADVAVVTPIGLEHQGWLGDTLADIASHKAGIIKRRHGDDANDAGNDEDFAGPEENLAILAPQEPEAMEVLLKAAVAADAAVARQGSSFGVAERAVAVGGQMLQLNGLGGKYEDVFLPLSGEHQAHNAALALAAVEGFFGVSQGRQLDIEAVRAGFAEVRVPGRMERVKADPIIFVDSAHNPHGMASLVATLGTDFNFQSLVGVVGVLADKDARAMLTALEPVLSEVVITQPQSPRALDAHELAEIAYEVFGEERVRVDDSLISAVAEAIAIVEEADEDGMGIIATGSITTAAQVRAMFVQD